MATDAEAFQVARLPRKTDILPVKTRVIDPKPAKFAQARFLKALTWQLARQLAGSIPTEALRQILPIQNATTGRSTIFLHPPNPDFAVPKWHPKKLESVRPNAFMGHLKESRQPKGLPRRLWILVRPAGEVDGRRIGIQREPDSPSVLS